MRQQLRGKRHKNRHLRWPQWIRRALIALALLLVLLPHQQTDAQVPEVNSTNQAIFKNFDGTETPPLSVPTECTGENCDSDATNFYKPFNTTALSTQAFSSGSEMTEVQTTDMWPISPTVKLFSYWPSGAITTCSGMIVDAKVTLTAGSCVYTHDPARCSGDDTACWVTEVSAVPDYIDGEAPYGKSGYESIMTWTDWTEAQNSAFDLAAIRLRYPIGETTGWLGLGFNEDGAAFTDETLANTAYLQDAPYDGERIYGWEGFVTDVDTGQPDLFYITGTCDTGRVGASLNSLNGVAYGVFSHSNPTYGIGVTRITYPKFDSLRTFIEEGLPKSDDGGDLIPFDVRANPKSFFPGQKLSDFSFYLQNYSGVPIPFDTYQVEVFLSSDPQIGDPDDRLLHTFSYEGAFDAEGGLDDGRRITLPEGDEIYIPAEIHGSEPLGGTFYLGVRITGGGEDPANIDNNRTNDQQAEPIWVYDSDNNNYFFTIWFR